MTSSVKRRILKCSNKARLMLGFISLGVLLSGCGQLPRAVELQGFTMGTTYLVKGIPHTSNYPEPDVMQAKIDSLLDEINRQMSTYIHGSEISIFNRSDLNTAIQISPQFIEVLLLSKKIGEMTSGAFDVTMKPLVDLWGFGVSQPGEGQWIAPDSLQITKIKEISGMNNLLISGTSIKKAVDGIEIDLNAVAKGYGVDQVAGLVSTWFKDYMVEIGGEVRCKGFNASGNPWIIGIESPGYGKDSRSIQLTVNLTDQALATSGDYRRYFMYNGKAYSHVIDPRTGYPAESNIASATVIAPTCAMADGLATALMVLSPDHSLELVSTIPGVEVLLMIRKNEGLIFRKTAGFPANE